MMKRTMPPIIRPAADRQQKGTERPKLLVTIVERGKGKEMMKLYHAEGVNFHYQTIGHGTATSEIMDILGLDSKDKDIIISFSPEALINELIGKMNDELRGVVDTKGILFDLKLTGVSNMLAAALSLTAQNHRNGEKEMSEMLSESKYSLILVSVNQGYTENVLDTARKHGARGGTVVRARWSGDKAYENHHGITLQTEKEIIAIVVPNDIRNQIMDAVNAEHGMKTEANAVVCCTRVDHFAPI